MEPTDIYMNQQLDTVQTWKSKKKRDPEAGRAEKKDDPDYENVTMTFKRQHDLGNQSSPPAGPVSQVSQELEDVKLALSNSIQNELNKTAMNFSSRMDIFESQVKTLKGKFQNNLALSNQLKKLESNLKNLTERLAPPS
ncbi:mast cell-expressed membrane protein 1 isoform X2 [Ornithorhynchus anatinus]|uniref:mast cell-expressed membrane protein 1 isoform X2 n=1 Tax=Ornithorhynchus anatinus TaxID=9258 RepID=UPI0010A90655|nr:mast cell-expressed membrane protein 1 isoform X2 [Ornithorhynchus anatinus]